ncbi:hypothetical protein EYF80_058056 [Liparis tanakae]|uniref:Uncharacterized protein n=1 Tax=Liparis tanakae TaxID=230148 RepID=A0A4Z2ES91_9TELE|nr:hypothetical protein EYF80_058056 [Liparis tanakae]
MVQRNRKLYPRYFHLRYAKEVGESGRPPGSAGNANQRIAENIPNTKRIEVHPNRRRGEEDRKVKVPPRLQTRLQLKETGEEEERNKVGGIKEASIGGPEDS